MNSELEIHIGKTIEAKTGKKLPALAVRLLERLIHEREINAFLCQYGNLDGISFSKQLLDELNVSVEWKYEERLPLDGRALFVSNHPLGAMDGISLSYLLGTRYGGIQYLVNDMLYNIKPLQSVYLWSSKARICSIASEGFSRKYAYRILPCWLLLKIL